MKEVISPVAAGNGATIIHQTLAQSINGYRLIPYNPWITLFPPLLRLITLRNPCKLIHTTPDYAPLLRRRKTPLMITFHNYVLDRQMQAYSSLLQKIHYRTDLRYFTKKAVQQADIVTAVSQFTANLAKCDLNTDKDIRVIPNGVDEVRFTPDTGRKRGKIFKVLFSGNMTCRKGAHWLPAIAGHLPDDIQIYCATGLRSELPKVMQHPKIRYVNKVPYEDMPAVYQGMDALLMPTTREGLSLAVLEAMACGLPVVASNCSSLPEQVIDQHGGHLCKTGIVRDYADAIISLSNNRVESQAMGQFNRERIESAFRQKDMINAYRQLFDEL